jgi:hypothetical protein
VSLPNAFLQDQPFGGAGFDLNGHNSGTGGTWQQLTGAIVFDSTGEAVRSNTSGVSNYINVVPAQAPGYIVQASVLVVSLTGQAGVCILDPQFPGFSTPWAFIYDGTNLQYAILSNGVPIATFPYTATVGQTLVLTLYTNIGAYDEQTQSLELQFTGTANGQFVCNASVSTGYPVNPDYPGLYTNGNATDSTGLHISVISAALPTILGGMPDDVCRALLNTVVVNEIIGPNGNVISLPGCFTTLDDNPTPNVNQQVCCKPLQQNPISSLIDGTGRHVAAYSGGFRLSILSQDATDQPFRDTFALTRVGRNMYQTALAICNALNVEFLQNEYGGYIAFEPIRCVGISEPRKFDPTTTGKNIPIYRYLDVIFEVSYSMPLTLAPTD